MRENFAEPALLRTQARILFKILSESIDVHSVNSTVNLRSNKMLIKRIGYYLRKNLLDATKLSYSRCSVGRSIMPRACNCTQVRDENELNEYNEIWKYSFFSLASLLAIVSIILILVLIGKIIAARFCNKKRKRSQDRKPRQTNLARQNSSMKRSNKSLIDQNGSLSSSEPSSISNDSIDVKTTEKIQRNLLDISSLKAFMDQQEAKRQANILRQREKGFNSNMKTVGIANKGYQNDEANHKNLNIMNSLNCRQEEFITAYSKGKIQASSFRPQVNNIYSNLNILNKKSSFRIKNPIILDPNEYDLLETNTMCGSIANLSTVTSMSVETEESTSHSNSNCLNKNEHISRSSKITQELEARLKERRQIIEHKSYHQTTQQIDTTERSSDGKTSQTELDSTKEISSTDDSEAKKSSDGSFYTLEDMLNSPKENKKCACNCHSFSSKNHCEIITESSPCQRYSSHISSKSSNTNKKAKIVIDGCSMLPTKRESIRMLYENKAVTENPLKSTLETHFHNINTTKKKEAQAKLGC